MCNTFALFQVFWQTISITSPQPQKYTGWSINAWLLKMKFPFECTGPFSLSIKISFVFFKDNNNFWLCRLLRLSVQVRRSILRRVSVPLTHLFPLVPPTIGRRQPPPPPRLFVILPDNHVQMRVPNPWWSALNELKWDPVGGKRGALKQHYLRGFLFFQIFFFFSVKSNQDVKTRRGGDWREKSGGEAKTIKKRKKY